MEEINKSHGASQVNKSKSTTPKLVIINEIPTGGTKKVINPAEITLVPGLLSDNPS
ncbi:hypothetical protein [Francisella tularensis]|uniref:hypothetical protein n=1 Tax=Francisella tularensis TaxID=263 RepID=UPI0008F5FDFF|nr:hypothetical protein [Francisella tularensis]APA83029.1 hypothetical protein N894_1045 [Francisella tularensis subsp. novicida PA10-7858]